MCNDYNKRQVRNGSMVDFKALGNKPLYPSGILHLFEKQSELLAFSLDQVLPEMNQPMPYNRIK